MVPEVGCVYQQKPKQFLEINGKPIIVKTIEHFQNHPSIDKIVVVCLGSWISYMESLVQKYSLTKIVSVVSGGQTGQMSIFNGLLSLNELVSPGGDDIVLIHDGVRPLIDADIITKNIECVSKNRTAITVKPVIETVIQVNDNHSIINVVDRDSCQTAVAPQSFLFVDIYGLHLKAQEEQLYNMTDSATLARHYGLELYTVMGGPDNIKITTPSDFFIVRAIYEAKENSQIFG